MSIIGVSKANGREHNMKKFLEICKAWVITFPVCGLIGFVLCYGMIKILG